jgi:hypothetical protein
VSRVKGIAVRGVCLPPLGKMSPWRPRRRPAFGNTACDGCSTSTAPSNAGAYSYTYTWACDSSVAPVVLLLQQRPPIPEGTKTEGTQQGQTEVAELSVNCDLCLGAAAAWRAFEERPTGRWRLGDGHGLVV